MEPTDLSDLRIAEPRQTLREIAVARLRAAIVSGRFASGDRLVERVLGDQLGVSRTVIREAIRYLEAEGLVEIAPRIGPIVSTLDWEAARQIYAIRLLLEAQAAADCARRIDAEGKASLRKVQAALAAAATAEETPQLYQATSDFYEVIFKIAGHEIAWEVVQRLNGRISRLRALTLASVERRISGPMRMAHIAETILAGDAEAAAGAVRDHLTEAAQIAHDLLLEATTSKGAK